MAKEDNLQPKIKEILIQGKGNKQGESSCEIFVYQPENIEEARLGSFFALGKMEAGPETAHIVNLLASTIKRAYYAGRKKKATASMEAGLKKANSTLRELAKNKDYNLFNKLHFVCATLSKNQLRFTSIGKIKVFLLRDGRLADVSKKLVPAQDKINPRKPFQSIASGKLFARDKIILATADLLHYIPQKGLKQIVESNKINRLETIIKENKEVSPQALLVIELLTEKASVLKQSEAVSLSENDSLKITPQPKILKPFPAEKFISDFNLFSRNLAYKIRDLWRFSQAGQYAFPLKRAEENQTAEIGIIKDNIPLPAMLGPPDMLTHGKALQAGLPATAEEVIAPQEIVQSLPSKTQRKKAPVYLTAGNSGKFLKIIFLFAQKTGKAFLPYLRKLVSGFHKYSPRQQKIIVGALIIAILSAAIGRQFLYGQYQKQISENEASASQSQEKIDQLNKIIHLDNLSPVGSIPANNFGFIADKLLITENGLIITTRQNADVFYSLPFPGEAKSGNFIPTELPKDKNWLQAVVYKNNLILLAEDNSFYNYDFTSKTTSRLDNLSSSSAQFQGITTFGNNLYLLEATSGQIIKCPALENCQNWLGQKGDFESASSLAIDGSIFVLFTDGKIAKYFNGARESIIKPKIKPLSSGFEKIFTDYDFKNIYLLDKEQKRIIVIDKKGNLIKQYFSSSFENAKDIQISSDEKTIYVLSENKIYEITN
jgi:hypothetical protein